MTRAAARFCCVILSAAKDLARQRVSLQHQHPAMQSSPVRARPTRVDECRVRVQIPRCPSDPVIPTEAQQPRIFFRLAPTSDHLISTTVHPKPRNPAYAARTLSLFSRGVASCLSIRLVRCGDLAKSIEIRFDFPYIPFDRTLVFLRPKVQQDGFRRPDRQSM